MSIVGPQSPSPDDLKPGLHNEANKGDIYSIPPNFVSSGIRLYKIRLVFTSTESSFTAGEVITRLEGLSKGPKDYTSVQCGPNPDDHIELNSDLVFVNHSCEPNVAFDLSSLDSSEWHIRALKDIEVGMSLSFFYPSTEWAMHQHFDCQCGADSCLKRIQGSAYLPREELQKQGFINSYIWAMIDNYDGLQ